MCSRWIVCAVVVITTACAVNCEDSQVPINITGGSFDVTQINNSTVINDKNFWEWLLNIISGITAGTTTTTEPPKPEVEPEICLPCKCGLTNTETRIVGGSETQVNEYPWMALMMFRGRFYCGGTVINSRYILTAAHCVDRFDPSLMSIKILEHNRSVATDAQSQDFKVEKVTRHSGYSTSNYNNDIALVRLKNPIRFEGKMRPVCLPEKVKTFAGEEGIVTGWGAVGEGGPVSETLQEVTVPILSNTECRATKYPSRRITDNMLCAGYKEGGKDSCQGDSGGPLHVANNKTYSIVGIVSWGEGCAQPGYPGVYTRVNRYLTWIKFNTQDGCYC